MAASGLKVALPTSFTDTTLPFLREDSVIASSVNPGTLLLCDMAHSFNPAGAGVASGLRIPNIAVAEAAALLGSGDVTTLSPTLAYDASYVDGTTGKFERTSKGGLHGAMSQTAQSAANQGAFFKFPDPIKSYILANPTHSYFLSLWDRITKVTVSGASLALASIHSNASAASNYLFGVKNNGVIGLQLGSAQLLAVNTLGNTYYELGSTGYVGTVPALGTLMAGVWWGPTTQGSAEQSASTNYNKTPSHIFYRVYLEDLTVSGRTFAAVSALDQAAYAQAFGSGGRYNGDTFTAPTTLVA